MSINCGKSAKTLQKAHCVGINSTQITQRIMATQRNSSRGAEQTQTKRINTNKSCPLQMDDLSKHRTNVSLSINNCGSMVKKCYFSANINCLSACEKLAKCVVVIGVHAQNRGGGGVRADGWVVGRGDFADLFFEIDFQNSFYLE